MNRAVALVLVAAVLTACSSAGGRPGRVGDFQTTTEAVDKDIDATFMTRTDDLRPVETRGSPPAVSGALPSMR